MGLRTSPSRAIRQAVQPIVAGLLSLMRDGKPRRSAKSPRTRLSFSVEPLEPRQLLSGTGLVGEYYGTQNFTDLKVIRTDATVNFNWNSSSPDPSMAQTNYSVRWVGQVEAEYSETYTFYTNTDDGARLWVNGQELVNDWQDQGPTEYSGTIALQAGQKYNIEMDYYQDGGGAVAQLSWSSPSQSKEIVPEADLYAPDVDPPSTPTGLTATATSDTGVSLNWTDNANDEVGFVLERSTDDTNFSQIAVLDAGTTSYSDTGLAGSTEYYYRIKAINDGGDSSYANTNVTTLSGPIAGTGTGLAGEYFLTENLADLDLIRVDPTIDFNWSNTSPDPSIGQDYYSVEWDGQVQAQYTETYTFTTNTDDGTRLWVNGQELINQWNTQGPTEYSGTIALQAGQKYDITMQYFQATGGAVAQLYWSSPSQAQEIIPESQLYAPEVAAPAAPSDLSASAVSDTVVDLAWTNNDDDAVAYQIERSTDDTNFTQIASVLAGTDTYTDTGLTGSTEYYYRVRAVNVGGESSYTNANVTTAAPPAMGNGMGLVGEYYSDGNLGSLDLIRTDSTINFNWNGTAPDPTLNQGLFSVRWVGEIEPLYSETYTFYTDSDDGSRLWVNGQEIINHWGGPNDDSGTITLQAGEKYTIEMDYNQQGGQAYAQLLWSSLSQAEEIVPQSQLFVPDVAPPTTPSSLTATATSPTLIGLAWTDSADDQLGYEIDRSTDGTNFSKVAIVGAATTSYTDSGLAGSTTYYYRVSAINDGGASGYVTANATTPAPPTIGSGNGLAGEYFDTKNLVGLQLVRVDNTVNFNWNSSAPDPSMSTSNYSVRWLGDVQPLYSETYTFSTTTDDGVRLWVNGQLLIDKWQDQGATQWSGSITLVAGQKYSIEMDYYQDGGGASAQLAWSSPSQTEQIIPESQLYAPDTVAPAAPTDLTATAPLVGTISLTWNSLSDDEQGTIIERKTGPDGTYSQISSLAGNITSYDDMTVTPGTQYFYEVLSVNGMGASSPSNEVNITASVPAPPAAQFLDEDDYTSGDWKGVYGSDGYNILGDTANYPDYVSVSTSSASYTTWTGPTTDPRALLESEPGSTEGVTGVWYGSNFNVNVNFSDSNWHELSIYVVDWDSTSRAETVTVEDANTGDALDTETVSNFHNGAYLSWNVQGDVTLAFTQLNGANAVVSGLFIDPLLSSTPPAAPTNLTASAISSSEIDLSWQDNSSDETGFQIERSTDGTNFTPIAVVGPNVTSYANKVLNPGTLYYYKVNAIKGPAGSDFTNTASATTGSGLLADWSFDEGTGATAADGSENGNTATFSGGVAFGGGEYGSGLDFDSTGTGYATVADSSSLDPTSQISITAWISATDWNGNRRIVEKGANDNQYMLGASNGQLYFLLAGVGSLSASLPSAGTWHHVAATYNGTTMALYVDGTEVASMAASGNIATTNDPLIIGSKENSTASGDYFYGALDEVRIYDAALSATSIAALATPDGDETLTPPTGLTAVFVTDGNTISWNLSGTPGAEYELQRASSDEGPFETIADLPAGTSSYHDTSSIEPDTNYIYRLRLTLNGSTSPYTASVTAQTGSIGLPFEDNFDLTPDYSAPGFGWQPTYGWVVKGGQLESLYGTPTQQMLDGVMAENVSLTEDYDFTQSGSGGGFIVRSSSAGEYRADIYNYYNVTLYAVIERVNSDGSVTGLNQDYVDLSNKAGHLEFQVDGPDLDLYLNGSLVAHAVDSNPLPQGDVGIFTVGSQVKFDNFTADELPTPNPVAVAPPYTDAFNTVGQLAGAVYQNVDNYFVGSDGQAEAPDQNALMLIPGIQAADVAVTADISVPGGLGGRYMGLVLRASGNNMYRGDFNYGAPNASFDIQKEVNGVWTTLATTANNVVFGVISSGKLRFEADGSTLSLFFNDQPILSVQDDSITSAGAVGLFSSYDTGYGPGSFDNLAVEANPLTSAPSVLNEVFNTIQYQPYAGWTKSADATEQTGAGNDWDQAVLLASQLQALGYSTRYVYGRVEASYLDVEQWLGTLDSTQSFAVLETADLNPVSSNDGSSVTFDHAWIEANLMTPSGFQWFTLDPSWKFENRQPAVTTGIDSLPGDIQTNASAGDYSDLLLTTDSPYDDFTNQLSSALAPDQLSLSQVPYSGSIIARSYEQLLEPPSYTVVSSTETAIDASVPDQYTQHVRIIVSAPGGSIDELFNISDIATEPIILRSNDGVYSLTVGSDSYGAIPVADTDTVTITIDQYQLGQDTSEDLPSGSLGMQSYTRLANEVVAVGLNVGQISNQLIQNLQSQLNDLASRKRTDEDLAATYATEYENDLLTLGEWTYLQAVDEQRAQIAGLTGNIAVRSGIESGLMTGSGITQELYAEDQNLQYPVLPTRLYTDNPVVGTGVTLVPIEANLLSDSQLLEINRFIGVNDSALEQSTIEQFMNAPAMSTLDGFRWAAQNGVAIETLTEASQVPTLLAGLSDDEQAAIINALNDGYTVWAVANQVVTASWVGAVWIQEGTVNGQVQRQYMIMREGGTPEGGGDSNATVDLAPVDQQPLKTTDVADTQADPSSGDAILDTTDFSLPNVGLPVDFSRHYDSYFDPSQDVGSIEIDDGMGIGWIYTFGDFLTLTPATDSSVGTIVWHTSSGLRLTFTYNPSTGTYEDPTGTYGTFESLGGGEYADLAPDGTQYYFKNVDGATKLDKIVDRDNNELYVNYSGGLATQIWSGTTADPEQQLLITLSYYSLDDTDPGAAPNHIETIEDDTGRTWNYYYTAIADATGAIGFYLTSVQGPTGSAAKSVTYAYYGEASGDSLTYPRLSGLLRSVTDNVSGAEQIYSYYSNRRVFSVSQEIAGSASRTEYLSYDLYNQTTQVTDFSGNTTTLYYTPDGQVYKTVMPDGSQATTQYAGDDEAGLFDNGTWTLDMDSSLAGETPTLFTFTFGQAGDLPVVGDWTGDGTDNVGVFRVVDGDAMFYLDASGSHEFSQAEVINFGPVDSDALPVVGDWNGNGVTDVGIYENGEFILDTNGDGVRDAGDATFTYTGAPSGAVPIAGDWNGDGQTEVGLYADGTYYLDVNDSHSVAQSAVYMVTTDSAAQPVVGYWSTQNISELGIAAYAGDGLYSFALDANDDHVLNDALTDLSSIIAAPLDSPSSAIAVVGNWDGNGERGFALAQTDQIGRTIRQMQNTNGNVVWQVAADGMETQYTYQPAFNGSNQDFDEVTEARALGRGLTPEDRVTQYTYDANGNPTSIEDPLGDVTVMEYDSQGRLIASTSPNGAELLDGVPNVTNSQYTTTYTYEPGTDLVTEEDQGDGLLITNKTYDSAGDLLSSTQGAAEDGTARTTTNTVDALGDVLTSSVPDDTDGSDVTTNTYVDGLLASTTDPDGHTTQYTYNSLGELTQTTFADGTTQTIQYDNNGNVIARTDELGRETQYFYDTSGNLVETLYADGTYTLTRYDGAGRAIATTDQSGQTTTTTYDVDDRTTSVTQPDPDGSGPLAASTTTYQYDDLGLIQEDDPQDHTTAYVLDQLGRVIQSATYLRDSSGNVTQLYGVITQTRYDADGNVVEQDQFDATGLTSIPTDPAATLADTERTTTYTYDALDRKTSQMLPDPDGADGPERSPETTYSYDSSGNLVATTDPLGHTTVTLYDAQNRVVGTGQDESDATISSSDGTAIVTLVGSDLNTGDRVLIRGATDGNLNGVFTVTRIDSDHFSFTPNNGDASSYSGSILVSMSAVSTTYDAAGNVASVTDAQGNTTTYTYDVRNRKISETQPGDIVTQYGYDAVGNLISVTDPRGFITTYAYDALNRKVSEQDPDSEGTPGATDGPFTQYAYDANGNLVATTDPLGHVSFTVYDVLNRPVVSATGGQWGIVSASDNDGVWIATVTLADNGFTVGQRVAVGGTADSAFSGVFVVAQVIDANTFTYVLSQAPANPSGGAAAVSAFATSQTYRQDGLVASTTDVAGHTTTYEYNAAGNVSGQIQPDAGGNTDATDSPTTTYTYDGFGDLTSVTSPLGNVTGAAASLYTTTYLYDALGRKIESSQANPDGDSSDPLVTTYQYDADGNLISQTDPMDISSTTAYDGQNRPIFVAQGQQSAQLSISGTTATVTLHDHGFESGELVYVTWGGNEQYGGIETVTVVSPDTFTFTVSGDSGGSGSQTGLVAATFQETSYDANGNVIAVTDGRGNTTEYQYDALNRKIAEIQPSADGTAGAGGVTTYAYDADGNLISVTDPIGNSSDDPTTQALHTTTYGYDALDRRISQTLPDADGDPNTTDDRPTTTYIYDLDGNLVSETDPMGNMTTYSYDLLNRKVAESDPAVSDGGESPVHPVTTYSYDAAGNLISVTDPNGNTTTYTYDALNRKTSETQPEVNGIAPVTTYTYDLEGHLLSTTDPLGNTTQYTYDSLGRQISVRQPNPDGSTSGGPVTQTTYDADGRVVAVTDPLGHTTITLYNALGQTVGAAQAAQAATVQADGLTATVTLANNPFQVGDRVALSSTTADSAGFDGIFVVTAATSDSFSYALSSAPADSSGGAVLVGESPQSTQYDADANVIATVDALGNTTTYQYDALGQKIQQTLPDPNGDPDLSNAPVTTYGYDLDGNLTSVTDPLGNQTTYVYDALGRKIEEIDPAPDGTSGAPGSITRYGYDLNGNLIWTIDPLGNQLLGDDPTSAAIAAMVANHQDTTTTSYDALNRKIEDDGADADGNPATTGDIPITTYAYDLDGNLISVTDPSDNVTQYTYDALNRQTSETIHTDAYGDVTETTAYNADGEETSSTDFDGRVMQFTYDDLGRKIQEVWKNADGTTANTINSTYDLDGNLLSTSDDNSSYTYTYDAQDRLLSSDNSGTPNQPHIVLTYAYDADGRNTSAILTVNGAVDMTDTYVYDDLGRVISVTQNVSDGSAQEVTFSYDLDGQLVQTQSSNGTGGSLPALLNCTYQYDDAGHLVSIQHTTTTDTTLADYSYVYDANNRTTQMQDTDGETDYTYDDNGQLLSASGSATSGGQSYQYDDNGNRVSSTDSAGTGTYTVGADNRLLSDGTYTYEYDQEGNRIERTNISTGEVTLYSYDLMNRLTGVTEKSADGTLLSTVTYTYDVNGNRLSQTIDSNGDGIPDSVELYGYNGSSLIYAFNGSGVITDRFLQTPGATDKPLADQNAATGVVTWQLADQEGTIRDTIDSSADGTLSSSIYHVQFDAFGNVIGSNQPVRFGYTGQQQDAATGLVYMGARYYDPTTGQFISQDPASFSGGDTNLYRYVGNNVPNLTDPLGLAAEATRPAVIQPKWQPSDFWGDLGDFFNDGWKSIADTFEGKWKDALSNMVDSGGSLDRAFDLGSIGLNLGAINFSFSGSGDENTADIGLFGLEIQLNHNTQTGSLDTNVGAEFSIPLYGANLNIGYIDSTFSLGVSYGVASTDLSLTHGRLSEGFNIGLVDTAIGQNSVGLGYGITIGPNSKVTSGFNATANAEDFGNQYLGLSGINSAYSSYQDFVTSEVQGLGGVFNGVTSGNNSTYQPNAQSPANPFLPPSYLLTLGLDDNGLYASGPLYEAAELVGSSSDLPGFVKNARIASLYLVNQLTASSRILGGLGLSILSGDILDNTALYTNFNNWNPNNPPNVLTFNGIFTGVKGANQNLTDTLNDLGLPSDPGADDGVAIPNGSYLGIGDIIQIVGEELGLVDLPSLRGAYTINQIAAADMAAGNIGGTPINVFAHSQGTQTFLDAASILDLGTLSMIAFHGYGGEAQLDVNTTPGELNYNGLGYANNVALPGDPVPTLGSLNIVKDLIEGQFQFHPFAILNGFSKHGYEANYAPFIKPSDYRP